MAQQKWNLGDIRPPERSARPPQRRPMQDMVTTAPHTASPRMLSETDTEDYPSRPDPIPSRTTHSRRKGKKLFIGLTILSVILIGFVTTLFFQGAELTIYPKTKDVSVQATFTAYQQPASDMLGFELLSLDETGERTVAATGSEQVAERATGEITIYNTFSAEPQRLVQKTRFEAPDGRIFRITEPVVIPGYTINAAKEKVPGTVTAKITADDTGDAYNIAATRFTIPGFKDSPQFDTISAESKAPMHGGFVGRKLIVDDAELARTKDTIRAELQDKLIARLKNERPAGFVLYDTAARIRFESLPSTEAGNNQATIRERAVLEAPLFADADFARYVAQNTVVGYQNEDVRIDNASSLTFAYTAGDSANAPQNWDKTEFTLSGNAKIVWKYDQEKLRQELVGVSKATLPAILLRYQPAIERATTVMRPFWKRSFPRDPKKIRVVEMLGSQTP